MNRSVLLLTAVDTERTALEKALLEAGAQLVANEPWVPSGCRGFFWPRLSLCCVVGVTGQSNAAANAESGRIGRACVPTPDIALMMGTACALKDALVIGAVVVSQSLNYLTSFESDEQSRTEIEPIPIVDRSLVDVAKELGFIAGQVIAGDQLITNESRRDKVREKYGNALVVEMEGGGFLSRMNEMDIPSIVVRAVMDRAVDRGAPTKTENRVLASEAAAAATVQILSRWAERSTTQLGFGMKITGLRARSRGARAHTSEAQLQSEIHHFLQSIAGSERHVALESPTPGRGRIDIEADGIVVEVERTTDLSTDDRKLTEGRGQLREYLPAAAKNARQAATGLLTDGVVWQCYELQGAELAHIDTFTLKPNEESTAQLVAWLANILSAERLVLPTPDNISARLGARSPAMLADRAQIAAIWESLKDDPEARLKRDLWARSLETALGSQFTNDTSLFVDHTYLVVLAELIANTLIGVDITNGNADPGRLISGAEFADRQIGGVVESDFFDWPLHSPFGAALIRRICRRVAQFDWSNVDHDVLKLLYESVIPQATRKALGEYYTPDWLAVEVVNEVVDDPLHQSVLDPSCGSGTFLFHAVRRHLAASDKAGFGEAQSVESVTNKVIGFDLHPVAVSLARVTYMLAIGTSRLSTPDRQPVHIPVYLADSLRWTVTGTEKLDNDVLTIVGDSDAGGNQRALLDSEFRFPGQIVRDPARFERLLTDLAEIADLRIKDGTHSNGQPRFRVRKLADTTPKAIAVCKRHNITNPEDQKLIASTLHELCRLVDAGRDGIWQYYIRNQARPAWLSADGNGVDCLVGNPPWLNYANMTKDMQPNFSKMCKERGIWTGGSRISGQDLSALFVARTCEMYLRAAGRFGFVMPESVLRSKPYKGFRSAIWSRKEKVGKRSIVASQTTAHLEEPWNLGTLVESFPVPSSVVFGRLLTDGTSGGMPSTQRTAARDKKTGAISFTKTVRSDAASAEMRSPYARRFRQGAILVPRVLSFVNVSPPSSGAPARLHPVESERRSLEKPPWKHLPSIRAVVDRRFLFPVHLGETVLPFRVLEPRTAILPIGDEALIDEPGAEPGIAEWWRRVEDAFSGVATTTGTFRERLDFHGQLSAQVPTAQVKVVYTKSGNKVAAAVVTHLRAIIDHKLYWATVGSEAEGHYLTAILNSETVRSRTEGYQSRGLFGPKDFDKYLFVNPIPAFDAGNAQHAALAQLGSQASKLANAVEIDEQTGFQVARGRVRRALAGNGLAGRIDAAVAALLDSQP